MLGTMKDSSTTKMSLPPQWQPKAKTKSEKNAKKPVLLPVLIPLPVYPLFSYTCFFPFPCPFPTLSLIPFLFSRFLIPTWYLQPHQPISNLSLNKSQCLQGPEWDTWIKSFSLFTGFKGRVFISKEEVPCGMTRAVLKSTHPYLEPKYLLHRSAKCPQFLLKFQNLGKLIHSRGFYDKWLIYNVEQGPTHWDSGNWEEWGLGQFRGSGWVALAGNW